MVEHKSSNPRRFVLTRDPISPLGVAMEHAKTGPWVPWEDCEVLIRERDEARDEAERMRRTRDEEIRRLRSAHETSVLPSHDLLTSVAFEHKDSGKFERARAELQALLRASPEEPRETTDVCERSGDIYRGAAPGETIACPGCGKAVTLRTDIHATQIPRHLKRSLEEPTPERLPQSTWTCEHCARVNDTDTTFNRCPFCDEFRKGYAEKRLHDQGSQSGETEPHLNIPGLAAPTTGTSAVNAGTRSPEKARELHAPDCQARLTHELGFKTLSPCTCGAENGTAGNTGE